MLTEASFITTAPQLFEGEPVTIIPGMACAESEDWDAGRPFLKSTISRSPG
jgi:hypothetical protein